MDYTYKTSVNADFDIDKHALTISTEITGIIYKTTNEVLNFKEECIKSSLIKLGWTPPKPVDKDNSIR